MKTQIEEAVEYPHEWHDVFISDGDFNDEKGLPMGPALFVYLSWTDEEDDEGDMYQFAIVGPALPLVEAAQKNESLWPLCWDYLRDHPECLVSTTHGDHAKDFLKAWALGDKPTRQAA